MAVYHLISFTPLHSNRLKFHTCCALLQTAAGAVVVPPEGCTSPKAYFNLDNGRYVFKLEGEDAAGNKAEPSVFVWNVDATPPQLLSLRAFLPSTNAELPKQSLLDDDGRVVAYKVCSSANM
jgi:hypothetical protein